MIELRITLKALVDGLTNRDWNDADEYNSMHVLENQALEFDIADQD